MVPSLPEEILEHIAQQLASDRQSLCNLSLVSDTFRRIAQPLLFRKFSSRRAPGTDALKLFLRTLLENPRHTSNVQQASLQWNPRGRYQEDSRYLMDAPADDLLALYTSTKDIFPPFRSASPLNGAFTDLCNGSEDAEVLLLLLLCPQISALKIVGDLYMSAGSYVIDFLVDQQKPSPAGTASSSDARYILQNLTTLHYEHWDTEGFASLNDIRHFFVLPRLTHLEGHMVAVSLEPSITCGLKEAQLTWSVWDVEGLSQFMQACPNLEVLKLEAGDACVGECTADFEGIGQALRDFGCSLRQLEFDCREAFLEDEGELYEDMTGSKKLGSLRTLCKLEKLMVPIEQLWDLEEESGDDEDDNVAGQDFNRGSICDIYRAIKDNVLPGSCTKVTAFGYFASTYGRASSRPARPNKCVIYRGINGDEKLELHLCRESSTYVGDVCSEYPSYDEEVAALRSDGQQEGDQRAVGEMMGEDEEDEEDEE